MLNIVVPMAGRGSRFASAGYDRPKPLIEVKGIPMIQLVASNLRPSCPHRFIFLCLREHLERFSTEEILRSIDPQCEIVTVEGVTQGAACTVLLAKKLIDSEEPLMIANSDQWVDFNIDDYLEIAENRALDGLIMTMRANDPKWSFVRLNDRREVTEVVEKQVVSDEATVGIYNFRLGAEFVSAAENMIRKNLRVNNEFYVAPAYNELIAAGQQVAYYNIGEEGAGMYGLGIPSDLELFLSNPVCHKALSAARPIETKRNAA